MRNNTRLKTLLIRYTVSFDLEGDGRWVLLLTDRTNNGAFQFEGKSYSEVLTKAYSHMLRQLKSTQSADQGYLA
jgi:hypothetical protein